MTNEKPTLHIRAIAQIAPEIFQMLNIPLPKNCNIYIGDSNIDHMKTSHPNDFKKYGSEIANILQYPDFVGRNAKDDSIEFVKEFEIDNEFVKVAVRISAGKKFFARSLYVLNPNRVKRFIDKGTLKEMKNTENK